jgi:hypothetical protein
MSVVAELQERPIDFVALIEAIYARKFTGRVILDFSQGVPLVVDFPSSVQIKLVRSRDLDKKTG